MLSLIVAAALATSVPVPEPLSLGKLKTMTPAALAPHVLPAETAEKITDGLVRRAWLPQVVYYVSFTERPAPFAEGLCRRVVHGTHLRAPNLTGPTPDDTPMSADPVTSGVQYAATYPGPATDITCQAARGWIAASPSDTDATLERLRRLTAAMNQAAGRARLDFQITCASETPTACDNPRQALAHLPLENLLVIRLRNTVYRDEPPSNGVQVRYMQPVADGRWPEAELSFNASGPDGRSWTVLMKGVDKVETIELRRSTIIRH